MGKTRTTRNSPFGVGEPSVLIYLNYELFASPLSSANHGRSTNRVWTVRVAI
jgi:hypothetical protein